MFSTNAASTQSDATKSAYNVSGPIIIARGTQRITGSHLESPWNYTENDEGQKRGDSYWYSLAHLLQFGTVQKIRNIYCGGEWVHGAIARSGDATAINENWGDYNIRMRVHWGTKTQTVDPRLNGVSGGSIKGADGTRFTCNAAPNKHPAYAGLAYVVYDTFPTHWGDAAGTAGTHIPDVDYETYTLNEVINPGGESERYGVNPIGTIYDLFTSATCGLGLSDTRIPLSAFQAKAAAFLSEWGARSYISPLITSKSDVIGILTDLMAYFRGYMPRDAEAIAIDWVHKAIDTGTLPSILSTDCTADPEIAENDTSETCTAIEIKYTDFDDDMGNASLTVRSSYGHFLTEEAQVVSKNLPWIHDTTQAREWGERELLLCTYPALTADITVPKDVARASDGTALKTGSLVLFHDDVSSLDYVCRVKQRKDVLGKGVQLKLVEEPGQWAAMAASEGGSVGDGDPTSEEETHLPGTIAAIRPWVVPAALRSGSSVEMAVLCDQPNYATAAEIYLSATGAFAGEEAQLDDLTTWTARGSLESDVTAAQTKIAFLPGNASALLSRSFTTAEIAAGYMLALVGDEVMILGALSSTSGAVMTDDYRPAQDTSIAGVAGVSAALVTNTYGDKVIRIKWVTTQTAWPYWIEYSRDGGTVWYMAGVYGGPLSPGLASCDVPLLSGQFIARVAEFKADETKIGAWTRSATYTFESDDPDSGVTYSVTRGAFGTTASTHTASDRVWIIKRAAMQRYTHTLLEAATVDCWINVVPVNAAGSGNPTGAIEVKGVGASYETILDGGTY